MIPRIILPSLLMIALVGAPGASAAVEDMPDIVVPDPCDEVRCEDLLDIVVPDPCDEVDCTPCNPSYECPQPCPSGTSDLCGHRDTVDAVTAIVVNVIETVQDRVDDIDPEDDGDYDNDGIPDQTEETICRNYNLRRHVEDNGLGYCRYYYGYDLVIDPDVPSWTEVRDDALEAAQDAQDDAEALAGTALALVPTQAEVEEEVDRAAPDADDDGVPDLVEQAVCGPALVRNNLNVSGYLYCVSISDLYVEPTGTFTDQVNATREEVEAEVERVRSDLEDALGHLQTFVEDTVADAVAAVDADGDGVADEAEPWLCQVENANFAEDGSCDEGMGDYTPPA